MKKYLMCVFCKRVYTEGNTPLAERDPETGVETAYCECGRDLEYAIEFTECPFCGTPVPTDRLCLCDKQVRAMRGLSFPSERLGEIGFDMEGESGEVFLRYTESGRFLLTTIKRTEEFPESESEQIIEMLEEAGEL